ncbi:MAG TPA: hypothetical protein VG248_17285 [Caulobacteraceae bacterium]|jgi:hypothetical protein|nr:hypothetical protein [Caulobacteraceae bacterium]
MSNKNSLMAGAARFAHLAGFAAKPKAENDPGDPDAHAEGKTDDTQAGDGDGKDCPECKGTGEDSDGEECEACGGTGEKDDGPGAEDDDDDEAEMRGRSDAAQARRRERSRCAAIFESKDAAANPSMAAYLAFDTNMPRKQALASLKASVGSGQGGPRVRRPERTDRSAHNPRVTPSDNGSGARREAGSSWNRSFAKAGMTVGDKPLQRG